MQVMPLFVALFSIFFIYLSVGVIKYRLKDNISLGAGDNPQLEIAIRVHGNFAEYIPLTLLVMWAIESLTLDGDWVMVMGIVLFFCRIAHVIGMHKPKQYIRLRQVGVLGTFAVLSFGALRIIWHYLPL